MRTGNGEPIVPDQSLGVARGITAKVRGSYPPFLFVVSRSKKTPLKTMAPKTMAPKTMAPKTMAPKTMAPKTMAPKTMAPKTMPLSNCIADLIQQPEAKCFLVPVSTGLNGQGLSVRTSNFLSNFLVKNAEEAQSNMEAVIQIVFPAGTVKGE